jgi:amidophosphoribosyltransferase
VREALAGKRVVVVDDSIVRGTTSRSLMRMVRGRGGARDPFPRQLAAGCAPCYYGIDMPTHAELVAHGRTVEQIREFIGVDSLGYLSAEAMLGWCAAATVRGLLRASRGSIR